MKKFELGNEEERKCFMRLGTRYFGSKVDELVSFVMLSFNFDHDGTFLDSANKFNNWILGFHFGESECLISKWINRRSSRQHMILSSTVSFPISNMPRSFDHDLVVGYRKDRSIQFRYEPIHLGL